MKLGKGFLHWSTFSDLNSFKTVGPGLREDKKFGLV